MGVSMRRNCLLICFKGYKPFQQFFNKGLEKSPPEGVKAQMKSSISFPLAERKDKITSEQDLLPTFPSLQVLRTTPAASP